MSKLACKTEIGVYSKDNNISDNKNSKDGKRGRVTPKVISGDSITMYGFENMI